MHYCETVAYYFHQRLVGVLVLALALDLVALDFNYFNHLISFFFVVVGGVGDFLTSMIEVIQVQNTADAPAPLVEDFLRRFLARFKRYMREDKSRQMHLIPLYYMPVMSQYIRMYYLSLRADPLDSKAQHL
jgi:hypothetical protein